MYKKIIIAILLITIITTTGCNSILKEEKVDYTSEQIIELIKNEQFFKNDNYTYSLNDEKSIKIKDAEDTQTEKTTVNIAKKKDESGKVSYMASGEYESAGTKYDYLMYYTDGFLYTVDSDFIDKREITEEKFLANFYETDIIYPLLKLSSEDFASIDVSNDGNTRVITAVVDFDTYMKKLVDDVSVSVEDTSETSFILKVFISKSDKTEKVEFSINTGKAFLEGELNELITIKFKESSSFELPNLTEDELADVKFDNSILDTKGHMADKSFSIINEESESYNFLFREMKKGASEEFIFENEKIAYNTYIYDTEGKLTGEKVLYFDGSDWYKGAKKLHLVGNTYETDSFEVKPITESEAKAEMPMQQLLALGDREFVGSGKLTAKVMLVEDIYIKSQFVYEEYKFPGFQENTYFLFDEETGDVKYIYYRDILYVFRINKNNSEVLKEFEWFEKRYYDDDIEKAFFKEELSQISIYSEKEQDKYIYKFYKDKIRYVDIEHDISYYFDGSEWYKEESKPDTEWGYVFVKINISDMQLMFPQLINMKNRIYKGSGDAFKIYTKEYDDIYCKYADYEFPELGKELRILINKERVRVFENGEWVPSAILFLEENSNLFYIEIFYKEERFEENDRIWFELYDSLIEK